MKPWLVKLALAIAVLSVIILVTGFAMWRHAPVNLARSSPLASAQLLRLWQAGEVAVLVRHTERCDQSENPCLGPLDGITRVGNDAAAAVGQDFLKLGMECADVISSPITRTAQTSYAMFGKDVKAQDWLASCGKTLRNDVVAHKRNLHNLVLITHSGCISDFEAQTGFRHTAKSKYGSSLFVHIDTQGKLEVLGIVNANEWNTLFKHQAIQQ